MIGEQFYVVVGIMAAMFAMMCGIFGMVIRAAAGWQKVKDDIVGVVEDIKNLIVQNEREHDRLSERVTYLERMTVNAIRNQAKR